MPEDWVKVQDRARQRQARRTMRRQTDPAYRAEHNLKRRLRYQQGSRDPALRLRRQARLYGLSAEALLTQMRAQGGRCANMACNREFGTAPMTRAHIDHDHSTGQLRGILCGRCNTAMGHLEDSAALLQGLQAYLTSANWFGSAQIYAKAAGSKLQAARAELDVAI